MAASTSVRLSPDTVAVSESESGAAGGRPRAWIAESSLNESWCMNADARTVGVLPIRVKWFEMSRLVSYIGLNILYKKKYDRR